MLLGIALGFVLGVAACIAYNYLKPSKFDKLTADAAAKVKDRL